MNAKKIIGTSAAFLLVFAGSAAATFFALPQHVEIIDLREPNTDEPQHVLTYKEKFVNNLTESATAGLHIEINDLTFDQYYTGESAKEGHNTISILPSNPATLDLALGELSLHGINFALTAPVAYSNGTKQAKYRSVHASLVNDNIYLNLTDNGNAPVLGEEKEEGTGGSWDFKYKVSTAPYETNAAGDTDNPSDTEKEDPLTRGTYQYEYGKLDWLVSDVLEILSDGGISVSFEGLFDNLLNGSSEANAEEEEQASSGIDTDAILDSLNQMVNVGTETNAYFVWNLPLGDKTISLGLGGDENAYLNHVDLPAKRDVNGATLENPVWEIQEGMSLNLSADIAGTLSRNGEAIDWAGTIQGDPAEYKDLADSAALFKNVASLIAKPEIGLTADFEIGHLSEAKEGSRTVLRKEGVSEAAVLHLDANVDAYKVTTEEGKQVKKRALEGIDANITIDKKREENEAFGGHRIGVAYLEEEEGFQGYLNVNDVMKAKTTKTYLDEFYTSVLKDAFSGSSEEAMDLSKVTKLLGKLGDEIQKIIDSDLVKGIKEGSYNSVLDVISSLRGDDNLIEIVLGLAPLGIEGQVKVTLSGRENASLAAIELIGIKLHTITLNGTLKTTDFVAPKEPSYGSEKPYESLSHLKGIGGQIKAIADDKSFKANLSGNLYEDNGEDAKLEIGGSLAFDLAKEIEEQEASIKEGRVNVGLTHHAKTYVQDHNIALGLQDDFQKIAFSYDTMNKSGKATVAQESEKGIEGLIDLEAAKTVFSEDNGFSLDFLLDFLRGDDRFSRLGASIMGEASSSLLSDLLNGQFFGLLENKHIISDFSLGDTTKITIDGNALGMDGVAIKLTIAYTSEDLFGADEEGNGGERGIGSLTIEVTKEGVKTFDLTISDLDTLKGTSAKAFSSLEGFTDFTPLANLGAELVNTLTMGIVENAETGALDGISYYGLEGSIDLDIAGYGLNIYDFNLDASVEGAETKIEADFSDLPVIRGLNGPDHEHYFRPNELEGKRDSKIYYYANGINPEGEVLLTRDSSYGRIKDVKDAVRMDGKDFTSDLLGWALGYSLGVEESIFRKEEETPVEPAIEEPVAEEDETESKGLFDNKGIHIPDVFKGFEAKDLSNGRDYVLGLDLGGLLGIGILGDVELTLQSRDLHSENGFSARCLTGLEASLSAEAKASNDNSVLKIANAYVTIGLTNFDADGLIADVNEEGSDFAKYFVSEVADSGIITGKGDLYDLHNGFQSDDREDPYYTLYGYDLRGLDEIPAGRNLYLGID